MGVSLYYAATRATPLTDAELAAVDAIVTRWNDTAPYPDTEEGLYLYPVDGAVLNGSTKLPFELDRTVPSLVHWQAAVTELRRALPDADWRVTVDDGDVPWTEEHGYANPALAELDLTALLAEDLKNP
ncbi:hypothetical protein [Actinosynnema pretiosum]|uniref:Uncharacterized protein n=1 Tax=Actinosynnema pretiosum TaxID=42197 RepID=A0A290ZB48_9PSEU|nr:hypothetical protein [Actinosynnema pretiosum]ATE56260.1 hypothetical protein CNX65_25790 [Actinosynnema pretiosum]